jgi:PhnB protein
MSAKVKPIPDGYRSVTPYLMVKGAAEAIDFYKRAFNARERMRVPGPGGKIMHAEIEIGDSVVMLAEEFPDMGALGPLSIGGTPVGIHLYVENVDAIFKQALSAGAREERPLQNQFYGDRSGSLIDPFGHKWNLATHVEEVSPEELQRRMEQWTKDGAKR